MQITKNNVFCSQKGAALVVVLFVATLLMVLGTGLVTLALKEYKLSIEHAAEVQAYYLAEAGIEKALAELQVNPEWRDGYVNLFYPELDGRIMKVTVQGDDNLTIISEAEVAGANQQIKVEVAIFPLLSYGLGSYLPEGSNIISGAVNGDVFSNGDLCVSPEAVIYGNVHLGGELNGDIENINGEIFYHNVDLKKVLSLTVYKSEWYAAHDYMVYEGIQLFNGGVPEGRIFVDGDVVINQNFSSTVLVSNGDVEIRGDRNFSGIIYCPQGSLTVRSGVLLEGVVVTGDCYLDNSDLNYCYPAKPAELIPGIPQAKLIINSWSERYTVM